MKNIFVTVLWTELMSSTHLNGWKVLFRAWTVRDIVAIMMKNVFTQVKGKGKSTKFTWCLPRNSVFWFKILNWRGWSTQDNSLLKHMRFALLVFAFGIHWDSFLRKQISCHPAYYFVYCCLQKTYMYFRGHKWFSILASLAWVSRSCHWTFELLYYDEICSFFCNYYIHLQSWVHSGNVPSPFWGDSNLPCLFPWCSFLVSLARHAYFLIVY